MTNDDGCPFRAKAMEPVQSALCSLVPATHTFYYWVSITPNLADKNAKLQIREITKHRRAGPRAVLGFEPGSLCHRCRAEGTTARSRDNRHGASKREYLLQQDQVTCDQIFMLFHLASPGLRLPLVLVGQITHPNGPSAVN